MHLDLLSIPQSGRKSCFSHSAHRLPTRKKLLYTVANPARGLLSREKKKKKKSGSAPPPPRAARSEKKKKEEKKSVCTVIMPVQPEDEISHFTVDFVTKQDFSCNFRVFGKKVSYRCACSPPVSITTTPPSTSSQPFRQLPLPC